ncbi:T9SS type A sorting domain-containing protein [Seonamhaeicola maritimus]|uniref:T9SS type A sorting domain-containing protein n=1 Tax=Seonamhaeicola maritimus TaxID=2591822 RepID=A0A5C7GGZ4_9FLAO|nr:T9SS type A sorting domain-containing protein [Seonamhaeicola maritimus]TXG36110.1 T9SS type A sorting domain-containing protein [Seonamhaeicola maritimus]
MKSRKITNTFFCLIALCFILKLNAQGGLINILNEDYFGFEVSSGDDGWWMQQPENFSIVNDKGANGSSRSLKYTNATSFSGSKKAFGSTSIEDMLIDLEPGTYDVKAMVWLEAGSQISNIRINFRTDGQSEQNVFLNISSIATGQWVEVTGTLNLGFNFSDTNIRVLVHSADIGIGTFYLDDLQLWAEPPTEIVQIPVSSKIETINKNNLTLKKGSYEISLKLWLDSNSTISNFYTLIDEPWVSTKWDLSSIAKDEWVELKEEFQIDEPASQAKFSLKVNNNPDLGGGKGFFYIDDIIIDKKKSAYEEYDNFTVKMIGETCPDKGNGQIIITAKAQKDYEVEFNGSIYDFSNELTITDIVPGEYDLCILVKNTTFKSCFKVSIEASENISGKVVSSKGNEVSVNIVSGTPPFNVSVNGLSLFETHQNLFNVSANNGDVLEVKTSKDCEGVLNEEIKQIKIYPNPVNNLLNIITPKDSDVMMFDVLGNLIWSKENTSKQIELPISEVKLRTGIYIIKVITSDGVYSEKVVIN